MEPARGGGGRDGAGGAGATGAASGGTSATGKGGSGGASPAGGAGGTVTAPGSGGSGAASGKGGTPPMGGAGSGAGGVPPGTGGSATGGAAAGGAPTKDSGTPRWCDGQNVLFCEDFDDFRTVDDLFNSWTTVSTTGGTFSFDTGAGIPSAPNALRVRTTLSSGVQALAVQKLPAFASAPSKIRMEFDFRIDAADTVDIISGAAFAGILTGSRVTDGIIGLEAGPGPALFAGYIASDGTDDEAPFTTPFPAENQWLGRFAVEITYSTAATVRTGCVQIYVAGVKQLPTCLKLNPLLVDPPFISVVLGIYSGGLGTTGDIQLRFDNVTLTAQ